MRYYYDTYKCILIAHRNLTKEWFLKHAGMRCGYAKDVFGRMYDSLFAESLNVIKIYKKYYHQEYATLEDMLLKKYCLSSNIVDEICKTLKENHDLFIFDVDTISYGEHPEEFLFSEKMYERTEKLLKMQV